jgi:hypothetical protein
MTKEELIEALENLVTRDNLIDGWDQDDNWFEYVSPDSIRLLIKKAKEPA